MDARELALNTSRPHPARVYDALLGGKDHYPPDQEVAEQVPAFFRDAARQNRAFMRRAVKWLAEQGIDQYLDIGTGIPTEPNLHQVAQQVNPEARVVYVDNDPIVIRHAEALLVSSPRGATGYVEADVREPGTILEHAQRVLDFERPVALSLIAVLHFIVDSEKPYDLVRAYLDPLPAGSRLVLTHTSLENYPEYQEQVSRTYSSHISTQSRTRAEVARFFAGLEFEVSSGVVTATEWHPEGRVSEPEPSAVYAGVARK